MEINKGELLAALEAVRPAVDRSRVLEERTHFVFTGEEVMTYNGELFMLYPFVTDFRCSVKADDLLKVLEGVGFEKIDMQMGEGEKLVIEWPEGKFGLSVYLGEEHEEVRQVMLRQIGEATKEGWYQLPKNFIEGARLCVFSAARDRSGGTQNAMYAVKVDGEDLLSGDNLRASWYKMEFEMGDYLIDSRHIAELIKYPVEGYCDTGNWIHFRTPQGVILSASLVRGDYPNQRPAFETQGVEVDLPVGLKDALTHLLTVTEGSMEIDKTVQITISSGKLTCRARKSTGEGERYMEAVTYKGPPITFYINPIFLGDVLDKTSVMTVDEKELKASFHYKNFRHVMMLKVE